MEENIITKEEYSNACKEVLEILKMIKKEDLDKIPSKEVEILKENANMDYKFIYNPQKDIKEQNVSKLAKAIIANYFIDYIATPNQKQKIVNKQKHDIEIIEEKKAEKYSYDNLFNSKKNHDNNNCAQLPIEVKKENFIMKIFRILKKFFKIK